jgi:hypothetical protein
LDTQETTATQQDKQITIGVPEDRVAEFYAFYGRFLAVGGAGRHRGRHDRPGRHGGGHRCDGRERAEDDRATTSTPAASAPGTEAVS